MECLEVCQRSVTAWEFPSGVLRMLPQMFRPTVSSVLARTIGHLNLAYPAAGLASIACWFQFAHWCHLHPIPRVSNGKHGDGRGWLWESVTQKEGLENEPVYYLEFG